MTFVFLIYLIIGCLSAIFVALSDKKIHWPFVVLHVLAWPIAIPLRIMQKQKANNK